MKLFHRALAGGAASVALTAGLLGAGPGAASAAPAAASQYGCPVGAVCIYPQDEYWRDSKPTDFYYSRGVHKLYNQFGNHWVYNNQTDGWTVRLCTGSNGTGCGDRIPMNWAWNRNLTPINSILIEP
ncbi:hypothetical protein L1I79_28900 [Strepomyces sp. STD 3.1]|uniref:hypothetical protein n=1 Tax=Streptomyces sp. NPDC058985 TaxID=3346684 RepID=UPI001F2D140F|nr:hypothetical protein [Streptomyces sp. STD 3.1]